MVFYLFTKPEILKLLKKNLILPTMNGGATAMRLEYYLEHEFNLLNMDKELTPDWLKELEEAFHSN